MFCVKLLLQLIFLSTLSLRRATASGTLSDTSDVISIHTLLAESDKLKTPCVKLSIISIHTLLAESDWMALSRLLKRYHFYPHSPCGERLLGGLWVLSTQIFLSTLSLRRATWALMGGLSCDVYFYPHSPCGERRSLCNAGNSPTAFLSTLSLRRATSSMTHTLRCCVYFYPHSPCGERPFQPGE